jgi:O-antigen biosynthesis protein WbqV
MAEPLLNRPQARFDDAAIARFFARKRVLITGAAGSVGSALAQALASLECEAVALLDHFDHGLIDVAESVTRSCPKVHVEEQLCDVRDAVRLTACMRSFRPDVVIHSAALKHVHMGERHPGECVLTNLVGVHNALTAAADAGARHFVLISSDKAAAPVCVMGASKRLAELYVYGAAQQTSASISARSVRFANVWGSQGSVLPRFAAQIDAGGPLLVTHPKMERFFMTSREAVGLILSVAAIEDEAARGAFYMEIGGPMSILEIGRDMIRASGRDIDIEFTGLRPGEKLSEQLVDQDELVRPSTLTGISEIAPLHADAIVTADDVTKLEAIARSMDAAPLRQRVFALLDERLGRAELAAG